MYDWWLFLHVWTVGYSYINGCCLYLRVWWLLFFMTTGYWHDCWLLTWLLAITTRIFLSDFNNCWQFISISVALSYSKAMSSACILVDLKLSILQTTADDTALSKQLLRQVEKVSICVDKGWQGAIWPRWHGGTADIVWVPQGTGNWHTASFNSWPRN